MTISLYMHFANMMYYGFGSQEIGGLKNLLHTLIPQQAAAADMFPVVVCVGSYTLGLIVFSQSAKNSQRTFLQDLTSSKTTYCCFVFQFVLINVHWICCLNFREPG